MSTEDINKVVVTLHKGVDVDAFIEEMNGLGNVSPYVPERAVEIYNLKEDSLRNVDFVLTRNEMEELRKDPRVLACRWGTKAENGMIAEPYSLDASRQYTRTNTYLPGNVDMPWQLLNTYKTTNQYTTSTNVSYAAKYTALGAGVDFIIQDTGLQVDHPEFTDSNGVSRVQQIDWYNETGIPGSMPANFYTDTYGHGTHCAGTAAGKYYGFAKESLIYVMTILSDSINANVPISQSFNLIRQWHLNKTSTSTGYIRPTVVNMSWGYRISISAVTGGVYRGTPWSGSAPQNSYGVITGNGSMPIIVDSVQADVDDCLDAGVIMIGASGNNRYKIDVPGGLDYNNIVYYGDATPYYYMRGSTPTANPDIMKIGAVALQNNPEKKATFSCTGPGVPFYIGGDYIQSSCSTVNVFEGSTYPVANYSFNPSYKVAKISGTSMASPGAAGLACVLLGSRPWYTQNKVTQWLSDVCISNRLQDNNNGYADPISLQGGPNKVMYNPWVAGSFPTVIQHTSPAQVDQSPEFTATLHGKF